MIPIFAPAAAVAVEAVGGFAAAAAEPQVLAAIIGGAAALGKQVIAKQAAAQAARFALGRAIVPWVGGVLLAGAVLYGGYKIVKHLKDKDRDFEVNIGKDGLNVKAGRAITLEEFLKALSNKKLIAALREKLKEDARQHNLSEQQLFASTLDTVRGNPAYKNISDDDKIKLAKRLTAGLL